MHCVCVPFQKANHYAAYATVIYPYSVCVCVCVCVCMCVFMCPITSSVEPAVTIRCHTFEGHQNTVGVSSLPSVETKRRTSEFVKQ